VIITGDLNVAQEQNYKRLRAQFEKFGLKDAFFEVHKNRKETFGVLDKHGKPLETLLTR